MSAEESKTPEPVGVLGDGGLRPGKYNMALIRRAIKNNWPIPPEYRKLVCDQMALIVGRSEDERNRIGAAKVLVAADLVNAKREDSDAREDAAKTPQQHLHFHATIQQALANERTRELLCDLSANLDAGEPGHNGQQGPVEDGPASEPVEPPLDPSRNGSH